MITENDEKYIQRCFELALNGSGKVSPNPLVGSVIVKSDKVIAEGCHTEFGKPHAEAEALAIAGHEASGATLYCNLEPCCHTKKKTPPCVPAIIESGIKRVVISNVDPNPEVSGKGIKLLQDAGIEVVAGVLKKEGKELNKFFFEYVKSGLPYVTLKVAQSADGKLTALKNSQTWITGKESAEFVHRLRAGYDAVLVGSNTVIIDDPRLNVRHVSGRNPFKIILDLNLEIPLSANVLQNEPEKTIIFTGETAHAVKMEQLKNMRSKIFILKKKSDIGLLDLGEIMKILAEEKIASVLVEGGAQVFSEFAEQKVFNELILLQGPVVFGSGLNGFKLTNELKLKLDSCERLGNDMKMIYKPLQ